MKTDTLSKIASIMDGMEDSQDFFRLFAMVDSGRVSLYRKTDPAELEAWAGKLVSLLSRIVSIVFNPAIVTTQEESVKRVEVAGKLTGEDFRRTVREPSFWRRGPNGMTPEFVHSKEKIDTADTYENRFLCMLIQRVGREFDTFRHLFGRREGGLLDLSPSRRLDYGPTGILSRFRSLDVPCLDRRERIGMSEGAESLLHRGNGLLRRLMASSFYHDLSSYPIQGEIRPTNVLVHHPLYSYCYRFYVQELRKADGKEKEERGYRTFVLLALLLLLRDEKFTITPYGFSIRAGEMLFRCLYARKGQIALAIYPHGKDLLLRSTLLHPVNGSVLLQANRLLLLRPDIDKADLKELVDTIRGEKYDDATMASLLVPEDEKEIDHVLVLRPGLVRSRESLSNYLRSLFLILREKGGFDYRCPVCGNDHLTKKDGGYYCPGCHSRFALCKDKADDILWITGLWRSR